MSYKLAAALGLAGIIRRPGRCGACDLRSPSGPAVAWSVRAIADQRLQRIEADAAEVVLVGRQQAARPS
jgi:hypothetical protein